MITILQCLGTFGLGIGSAIGPKLVPKYGVREVLLVSNVFAICGCGLKLILSTGTIYAGKFLHGVFAGIQIICMNKALGDTVPNHYAQAYGILVNAGITGGIFFSNFLGVLIPLEEAGKDAMMADKNWRVVYGFPIILATYSILVTLFKFR